MFERPARTGEVGCGAVEGAAAGTRDLQLELQEPCDAAVIDVMLPGRDGLGFLEEPCRRRVNTPVLIPSAPHCVDDRVKGLQAAGDCISLGLVPCLER